MDFMRALNLLRVFILMRATNLYSYALGWRLAAAQCAPHSQSSIRVVAEHRSELGTFMEMA
jgi:hypothetical protein